MFLYGILGWKKEIEIWSSWLDKGEGGTLDWNRGEFKLVLVGPSVYMLKGLQTQCMGASMVLG